MMKHLPTRKPNRLNNYDYSQNGAYFITICTKKRAEFFGEITGGAVVGEPVVGDAVHSVPHMHLSEYGIIAERILNTGGNSDVCLDTFVIMPNHIHMILIVLKRNPHKETRDAVDSVPYSSVPYTTQMTGVNRQSQHLFVASRP